MAPGGLDREAPNYSVAKMWHWLRRLFFGSASVARDAPQGELNAGGRVRLVVGDLTALPVDAIVNAANESLLGGGGVDGTIHAKAGPELLEECREIGGCPTGQVRITGGYRLPARHVIHAVGPIYYDGSRGEAALLRSCYVEALKLAAEHGLATLAFPCISTGIFGYPKEEACEIAVEAVTGWVRTQPLPREVVFCCYTPEDGEVYRRRLAATGP
jgi:O-acetyl-ADP-ribose deacetylase (regulator of RNase III)